MALTRCPRTRTRLFLARRRFRRCAFRRHLIMAAQGTAALLLLLALGLVPVTR
jgi:hypothetical protein